MHPAQGLICKAHAQGVRVEVETGMGASWPAEPFLDQLLQLLAAAPTMKLPSQLLLASQASAAQRCKGAYAAVKVHWLHSAELGTTSRELGGLHDTLQGLHPVPHHIWLLSVAGVVLHRGAPSAQRVRLSCTWSA